MELKSEKAFRIADLILRYQEETISEEEMEELRLWLKKSTEHQQQFENLNAETRTGFVYKSGCCVYCFF